MTQAQQQNQVHGEAAHVISGWMKALGQALEERLDKNADRWFQKSKKKHVQNAIGIKLDSLSELLTLSL